MGAQCSAEQDALEHVRDVDGGQDHKDIGGPKGETRPGSAHAHDSRRRLRYTGPDASPKSNGIGDDSADASHWHSSDEELDPERDPLDTPRWSNASSSPTYSSGRSNGSNSSWSANSSPSRGLRMSSGLGGSSRRFGVPFRRRDPSQLPSPSSTSDTDTPSKRKSLVSQRISKLRMNAFTSHGLAYEKWQVAAMSGAMQWTEEELRANDRARAGGAPAVHERTRKMSATNNTMGNSMNHPDENVLSRPPSEWFIPKEAEPLLKQKSFRKNEDITYLPFGFGGHECHKILGTLHVAVSEVGNIRLVDNFSVDPFVMLTFENRFAMTSVIKRSGSHAKWPADSWHAFCFAVKDPRSPVQIGVFDYTTGLIPGAPNQKGNHTPIGNTCLFVSKLRPDVTHEVVLPLHYKNWVPPDQDKVGWIRLTVTLRWCSGVRPLLCYMKEMGRDDGMEFKDEALMEMARFCVRGRYDVDEWQSRWLLSYIKEITAVWSMLGVGIGSIFGQKVRQWENPFHSARVLWFACLAFEHPKYIPLLFYTFLLWKSARNYFRARAAMNTPDEFLDACPRVDELIRSIIFGQYPSKWDRFQASDPKDKIMEENGVKYKIKTLVPYTKFKSRRRTSLRRKDVEGELKRRKSAVMTVLKGRKGSVEKEAEAGNQQAQKEERRRLMDWEKNYGYEEESEDEDEDEDEGTVKEMFTTSKHFHTNTYLYGKLKLGFMPKIQLWADRILNWIRIIARIFTWKDSGLTFWATLVILVLWTVEVLFPSQVMDDYLQVLFVVIIGPQNMLRGSGAGQLKSLLVLLVLYLDNTHILPLGSRADFWLWLCAATLKALYDYLEPELLKAGFITGRPCWECESDEGWAEYDEEISEDLETCHEDKTEVTFTTRHKIKGIMLKETQSYTTTYKVDWDTWEQVNTKNGKRRNIRRRVVSRRSDENTDVRSRRNLSPAASTRVIGAAPAGSTEDVPGSGGKSDGADETHGRESLGARVEGERQVTKYVLNIPLLAQYGKRIQFHPCGHKIKEVPLEKDWGNYVRAFAKDKWKSV